MEAGRSRPDPVGMSRFLIDHERCGAGFEVVHPGGVGSGRVAISCRGCSARHEYATASIEADHARQAEAASVPALGDRTHRAEAEAPTAKAKATGPARAPTAGSRRSPRPAVGETAPRRRRPSPVGLQRSFALTVGLVALALGAAVFAAVRLASGGDEEPVAAPPPVSEEQLASPPQAPSEPQAPASPPPEPASVPISTPRYTLAIPKSWGQRTAGGAVRLEPRGGGAVWVQIFHEREPGLGLKGMVAATADFLRSRVADARVSRLERLQVGGDPGFVLRATGGDRRETAVGLLSGRYRYLLLKTVRDDATPARVVEAQRVLASFRPR